MRFTTKLLRMSSYVSIHTCVRLKERVHGSENQSIWRPEHNTAGLPFTRPFRLVGTLIGRILNPILARVSRRTLLCVSMYTPHKCSRAHSFFWRRRVPRLWYDPPCGYMCPQTSYHHRHNNFHRHHHNGNHHQHKWLGPFHFLHLN